MHDRDIPLDAALHPASHAEEPGGDDLLSQCLDAGGPDNQVGDAGFILDRDEYGPLGAAGALAHRDQAGKADLAAVLDAFVHVLAGDGAAQPGMASQQA